MTLTRGVVWVAGFFPWHFLLRRLGVRLPTRSSARIYASVALPVGTVGAGWPWRALAAVLVARIWLSHADGQRRSGGRSHFDTLAPDYATQLSPTARERVVERKTALMAGSMDRAGIAPVREQKRAFVSNRSTASSGKHQTRRNRDAR